MAALAFPLVAPLGGAGAGVVVPITFPYGPLNAQGFGQPGADAVIGPTPASAAPGATVEIGPQFGGTAPGATTQIGPTKGS